MTSVPQIPQAAAPSEKRYLSAKAAYFPEEFLIAKMMRLAMERQAVDLAVGAPDFPAPDAIKEAAIAAIRGNHNQYALPWGTPELRHAIAQQVQRRLGVVIDSEAELTVTCGSTEAFAATMNAILDPGDEVIFFTPYYENHLWPVLMNGATARYVSLHRPEWSIDETELRAAFTARTKAIVLNTPHNPTGKVFSRQELQLIAELCDAWKVVCVSDEVYDHILFDQHQHLSPLQLDGMRERTVLINSLSKSFSITGWRIGYVIAPPAVTTIIRRMHDFLTAGAPAPLQRAGTVALHLSESYEQTLRDAYQRRRDRLLQILEPLGFTCYRPQGAFYLMAGFQSLGFADDIACTTFLIETIGVAVVPGRGFFPDRMQGHDLVRFCFAKAESTLALAEERLKTLPQHRQIPRP